MIGNLPVKIFQVCVGLYVFVAVVFTTHIYVAQPISRLFWPFNPALPGKLQQPFIRPQRPITTIQHPLEVDLDPDLDVPLDENHWATTWPPGYESSGIVHFSHPNKTSPRSLHLPSGIREETLLSKAFSDAIHPTRIIPFYFQASKPVDTEDVTITTLVTSNRFRVFKQLVERYRGPISVTIHIPLPLHASLSSLKPDHPSRVALNALHLLYASSPLFAEHVDVHLALSPFANSLSPSATTDDDDIGRDGGRQFNVWRNAARLFARSEFVMMLDVDFAVRTDWRGFVRDAIRSASSSPIRHVVRTPNTNGTDAAEIVQRVREGTAALVVPAFEYVKQDEGVDQRTFPLDKEALIRLVRADPPVITTFHASWAPGHNSTDYDKYYSLPAGTAAVYKVEHYQSAYEPYVITSKRVSWCDERFAGYGGNKAACLFEMYLSGVSFYVLSDHFLVHQSHRYEEEARREERKSNRKLYADFKEEACLRYIYRYYVEGTLHTEHAANARGECKKIRTIAKTVSQLIKG